VQYRAAVGGAIVAVPLWLLAKWGFAIYVTKLVGTGNLYGALGLLPLFLIWLNLSWLIFLFGAEVANAAANLDTMTLQEQAGRTALGPSDLLAAAAAVARGYADARGPIPVGQLAARLHLPRDSVQRLLHRLEAVGLVCAVQDRSESSYLLAKPPGSIPVLTILGVEGEDDSRSSPHNYDADLCQIVAGTWAATRSALGTLTLADAIAAGRDDTPANWHEAPGSEQTEALG
jgi:membrane protein